MVASFQSLPYALFCSFLSLILNFSSSLSKLPFTLYLPLYVLNLSEVALSILFHAGHSDMQGNGGAHLRPGICRFSQAFSPQSPSPPDSLLQLGCTEEVEEVLQSLIHTFNIHTFIHSTAIY